MIYYNFSKMTNKEDNFKKSLLNLAHKFIWEEILEELADECPNYDSCTDNYIETYQPMHNEGHD